jgi:hypothetical protein
VQEEEAMTLRSKLALLVSLCMLAATSAFAEGPPSGMFYANDKTYRTVVTPTDLPNVGLFDTLYLLDGGLAPVADAAPGDRDYNGGRWEARPVMFLTISPTQFTNAAALRAAAGRGEVRIGDVVKRFECPLIPMPHGS